MRNRGHDVGCRLVAEKKVGQWSLGARRKRGLKLARQGIVTERSCHADERLAPCPVGVAAAGQLLVWRIRHAALQVVFEHVGQLHQRDSSDRGSKAASRRPPRRSSRATSSASSYTGRSALRTDRRTRGEPFAVSRPSCRASRRRIRRGYRPSAEVRRRRSSYPRRGPRECSPCRSGAPETICDSGDSVRRKRSSPTHTPPAPAANPRRSSCAGAIGRKAGCWSVRRNSLDFAQY